MPVCGTCTGSISARSPGLQCRGPCGNYFHAKCVNLAKNDIPRLQMPGVSWTCCGCRGGSDVQRRRSLAFPVSDGAEAPPESISVLQSLQLEMKSLVTKYDTLLESVNFCSEAVSSFEHSMSAFGQLVKDMERITRENVKLRSAVNDLQDRVKILEQQSRINNLEICGVPEKEGENISLIISKVAEDIGCPISPSDVDNFYRVPTFDSSRPKPIGVKFIPKNKRDSFLGASKSKRRESAHPDKGLKIDNISNDVFVNEHLTLKNKRLLKKTKDAARANKYKFTWTRNACIFVRKDERSIIMKISNEDDIPKIV